jgi:hypothetical protein
MLGERACLAAVEDDEHVGVCALDIILGRLPYHRSTLQIGLFQCALGRFSVDECQIS